MSLLTVKGHITADGAVVGDERVALPAGPVELSVRSLRDDAGAEAVSDLLQFLNSLPAGTRTKEDIDRQIQEQKDEWDRSWDKA